MSWGSSLGRIRREGELANAEQRDDVGALQIVHQSQKRKIFEQFLVVWRLLSLFLYLWMYLCKM